jgi:hypothetical protein
MASFASTAFSAACAGDAECVLEAEGRIMGEVAGEGLAAYLASIVAPS